MAAALAAGAHQLQLDGSGEACGLEAGLVTAQELALFTVADGVDDAARAQLYLANGQLVQQLALVANLPGLVRAAPAAWATLSAPLCALARQLDGERQAAAAASLGVLARERLLPAADLANGPLQLALAGAVGECGSCAAAQAAWQACLADLAAAVEPGALHAQVLPAVMARGPGGSGRSPRDRCLCAALLGAMAPNASADDLQRKLLRLSAALCQDTEWQVRHAMAAQLPGLARGAARCKLGAAALGSVLDDLLALVEDEEALVRAAAWRSLTAALDLLPLELRRTRAVPLLLRQCRDTDHHAEVQRSLAASFASLVSLVPDMEGDADVSTVLGCYRSLAWRCDHQTRLAAAAALPAMLRAGTARRYGSHLHDTLLRLTSDADVQVRLAAADALPEVAAALGRERCSQFLRQPLVALLQDERSEVAAALLEQLPALLAAFNPAGGTPTTAAAAEEQRARVFAPFVEPLLRAEAASGVAWRLQLALLRALPSFPAFFPADQLHDRFLPLALKYMSEGAVVLRDAAAAAAAALWRALRKPAHRSALYGRLIREFAQSKRFRPRMAFLDACLAAQAHFSCRYVRAHLLESALLLARDRVPNVRLRLAAALPALKRCVALPDDVAPLEALNSAMSALLTDGDGDVRHAARQANEEFKRQPVRMSCGALESSSEEDKAFEAADAARADAERSWAMDAEQLERIRADIAAHAELMRPADARLALPLPSQRGEAGGTTSRLGNRSSRQRGAGPRRPKGLTAVASANYTRSSSDAHEALRTDRSQPGGGRRRSSASMEGQQLRPSAASSPDGSGSSSGGGGGRKLSSLGTRPAGRLSVASPAAAAGGTADPAAGPAAQQQQQQQQQQQPASPPSSNNSRRPRPAAASAASALAPRPQGCYTCCPTVAAESNRPRQGI